MNSHQPDLCSGRDRNLPARTIVSSMFSVAPPPECIYIIRRNMSSNNKTNLRTFLRTRSHQHTTIGCNKHCKTTQKCTSLHSVDRIDRSGSQGQGRQSLGQNSTEFNFFAGAPRQYTGLLVFKSL